MGIKPGSEEFKALKTNAAEKLNRAKGKGKVKSNLIYAVRLVNQQNHL